MVIMRTEVPKDLQRIVNDMDRIDLKNMHSTELRTLKEMIQKELNFRDDIGKDIKKERKRRTNHE